jgi:hypothetical protein
VIAKQNQKKELFDSAVKVREHAKEFLNASLSSIGSAGAIQEIGKRKQAEVILN